jgi:hypothetical protein
MKQKFIVIALILLISSCNLHIEKRRYGRGYHVHNTYVFNKKQDKNDTLALHKESEKKYEKVNTVFKVDSTKLCATQEYKKFIIKPQKFKINPSITLNSSDKISDLSALIIHADQKKVQINKVDNKNISNNHFTYFTIFLGVCSLLFNAFAVKKSSKKRLSYWASKNTIKSRWLIALGSISIASIGFTMGTIFSSWGFKYNYNFSSVLVGLIGLSTIAYNYAHKLKNLFTKQLIYNFLLVCGLLQFSNIGIGYAQNFRTIQQYTEEIITPDEFETSPDIKPNKITFLKVLSVIALTVLFGFLAIIVAGLACELACSGYVIQAGVMFSVGNFLVLFLYFLSSRTVLYNKTEINLKFIAPIVLIIGLFFPILLLDNAFLYIATILLMLALLLYGLIRKEE